MSDITFPAVGSVRSSGDLLPNLGPQATINAARLLWAGRRPLARCENQRGESSMKDRRESERLSSGEPPVWYDSRDSDVSRSMLPPGRLIPRFCHVIRTRKVPLRLHFSPMPLRRSLVNVILNGLVAQLILLHESISRPTCCPAS